jgi:hypothetical protein
MPHASRWRRACLALSVAAPYGAASAQASPFSAANIAAIPRSELDAITARGRLLADYYHVSLHANEDIRPLQQRSGLIDNYVARKLSDGRWEVVFGCQRRTRTRVASPLDPDGVGATSATTHELRPPSADVSYYLRAAEP